jgi:hypothetical protein
MIHLYVRGVCHGTSSVYGEGFGVCSISPADVAAQVEGCEVCNL